MYKGLDKMNKEMVYKTGEDEVPRLKYITDEKLLDIPMLAPLVYRKHKPEEPKAPPRIKLDEQQTKLVNKIKLSI